MLPTKLSLLDISSENEHELTTDATEVFPDYVRRTSTDYEAKEILADDRRESYLPVAKGDAVVKCLPLLPGCAFCHRTPYWVVQLCYGLSMTGQMRECARRTEILVCTPGSLGDFIGMGIDVN